MAMLHQMFRTGLEFEFLNSKSFFLQHLPANFTRGNGLIKPGKIIMVDKKGDEWVMELKVGKTNVSIMYMYIMSRNGWRIFCDVNEVRAGESLTLELIRGGESPMLKFCSEVSYEIQITCVQPYVLGFD